MTKEPTIGDVLEAVQLFATNVDKRFDSVESRLDRVESRLDGVEHRLDGVEQQLDRTERQQHEMRLVMATKQDIAQLVSKEYLEGRLAHV